MKPFSIHLLLTYLFSLSAFCQVFALTGSWRGNLTVGPSSLPLVFNFSEDATGATLCTLDSPAQGAKGIPVTVMLCTADSIALKSAPLGATFTGRIGHDSIRGTFSQHGYSFPLNLAPETPVEDRRPQTPRPPFPYSVTDTTFTAPDGAVLSATLTMPADAAGKKVPAVVMVTGSGPQNRDEEIFEHRPFSVIADYLARHGIASLRYDDRGTGKSTGDFAKATTLTFKDDAASAISFLRSLPGIGSVGVLGHSEGGTIAFMLGADRVPDFIVSLAGMAVTGKETLMAQNSHALDRAGITGVNKESQLQLVGLMFDAMVAQAREGIFKPIDIDSLLKSSGLQADPMVVASLKKSVQTRTPWLDAFAATDPSAYLKKTACPLLAINGDKDTQVDAAKNLGAIKKLNPKAETRLMEGLNHLMQHAVTGEVSEYSQITETVSPEVLEIIATFISDNAAGH